MPPAGARTQPPISFGFMHGSPSGLKTPQNRPMLNGTVPSGMTMITLARERAQAVPQ
jgi:hypothetical protein